MIFFGPADFSQGIGAPCQWDHPKITETRKRIAEVCRMYDKFAGTVGSLTDFEELLRLGYCFINIGADVVGLGQYCRQIMQQINHVPALQTRSLYDQNRILKNTQ